MRLAVRAVRGRIAAIPWIMFGITAVLTSVGAVSPGAVAIIAPVALGFALKYSIIPLLMGLMVIHGAQAGGFSPISIYGGITNRVVARRGFHSTRSRRSWRASASTSPWPSYSFRPRRTQIASGEGASASTGQRASYGDSVLGVGPANFRRLEAEAISEEIALETGQKPGRSIMESSAEEPVDEEGGFYQIVTLLGLAALAVLVLAFNFDIGFVAITIGLVLSLIAPNLQKRAMGQVAWPEIMLITGVSTYVVVLEKMGTISYVGDSVAGLASPMLAALLLCFIGAVVSAFASSTAVLGSLIPLAVPFLRPEPA